MDKLLEHKLLHMNELTTLRLLNLQERIILLEETNRKKEKQIRVEINWGIILIIVITFIVGFFSIKVNAAQYCNQQDVCISAVYTNNPDAIQQTNKEGYITQYNRKSHK